MKSPISRYTVSGNSMLPALKPGQDVLSMNWFINPKVGDIIVLKQSGKELIKRIQKIDGDQVSVVGDNEKESTDSRSFGSVSLDQVVGKVIYMDSRLRGNDMVDCPKCASPVIGVYGRKDAICKNCGFKLACCGEP